MNNQSGNDLRIEIITQAIDAMKVAQGDSFSLENINLAELERRTGITRAQLRKLKKDNFQPKPHGNKGRKAENTILSGFTSVIDNMLMAGVENSVVILEQLEDVGYTGSLTTVKNYINDHKDLVPAKRQQVAPQGNRGRRYKTDPGEAFQMDWGFTRVVDPNGNESKVLLCFYPLTSSNCIFPCRRIVSSRIRLIVILYSFVALRYLSARIGLLRKSSYASLIPSSSSVLYVHPNFVALDTSSSFLGVPLVFFQATWFLDQ